MATSNVDIPCSQNSSPSSASNVPQLNNLQNDQSQDGPLSPLENPQPAVSAAAASYVIPDNVGDRVKVVSFAIWLIGSCGVGKTTLLENLSGEFLNGRQRRHFESQTKGICIEEILFDVIDENGKCQYRFVVIDCQGFDGNIHHDIETLRDIVAKLEKERHITFVNKVFYVLSQQRLMQNNRNSLSVVKNLMPDIYDNMDFIVTNCPANAFTTELEQDDCAHLSEVSGRLVPPQSLVAVDLQDLRHFERSTEEFHRHHSIWKETRTKLLHRLVQEYKKHNHSDFGFRLDHFKHISTSIRSWWMQHGVTAIITFLTVAAMAMAVLAVVSYAQMYFAWKDNIQMMQQLQVSWQQNNATNNELAVCQDSFARIKNETVMGQGVQSTPPTEGVLEGLKSLWGWALKRSG